MSTVAVTGASGFIAAHVVQQLLAAGHTVRGTVRDKDNAAKTAFLRELPGAAERLELFSADLTGPPGAFDDVVDGCEYVIHLASPFTTNAKDPYNDLVKPAVQGSTRVLESCARPHAAEKIKRVVLTSSMAAITDEPQEGHVFTEDDWNTKSTLTRNPYYKSKADAEKAAVAFVEEKKPPFDLVVINPFMVSGPSLSKAINTTVGEVVLGTVKGAFPGVVDLHFGWVDVRDVAAAHIAAMTKGQPGRYICAGDNVSFGELVDYVKKLGYTKENGYKTPGMNLSGGLSTNLIKLASYIPFAMPPDAATLMRLQLGRSIVYDNSKIKKGLGISFRPWKETIADTLNDCAEWGHVAPPPSQKS